MVCRLTDFALVVLKLLMFKVCGINGISKIKCFNFSSTKRVKNKNSNVLFGMSHLDIILMNLFRVFKTRSYIAVAWGLAWFCNFQ